MISSSLVSKVPPWKSTCNAPFDSSVIFFAISAKAMAPDSGGATLWAQTSFFGAAWAKAGAFEHQSVGRQNASQPGPGRYQQPAARCRKLFHGVLPERLSAMGP